MAKNRISLNEESISEMTRLILDKLVTTWWVEDTKKFLMAFHATCSKTNNEEYKNLSNKYGEFFGTQFPADLAKIVEEWKTSEMGADRYADNQGQDAYDREFARKLEFDLLSGIRSTKFNLPLNLYWNDKGSNYSDDEAMAEFLSEENTLREDLNRSLHNTISECESRVNENLMYNSLVALLNLFSDYIQGFDSVSPVKDFANYIEIKRNSAKKNIGKSSVKAQQIGFKK